MQRLRNSSDYRRRTRMSATDNGAEIADHDTFLSARQLFTRWGCKKTKGLLRSAMPGFS
ncbi:MAG: hypothetical protein WBQ50_21190 [Nocardioides sp.]